VKGLKNNTSFANDVAMIPLLPKKTKIDFNLEVDQVSLGESSYSF
jgi:hypothetical protein